METQFENIETTEVRSEDILDALMVLQVKYPNERTAIWAQNNEDDKSGVTFTAVVQNKRGDDFKSSGNLSSPFEAVKELLVRAGDRDPNQARTARINRLREELRKLEEEGRKV